MLYLDIARITIGILCIIAAGYWSAAAATIETRITRYINKTAAFAIMIAGALQLSFVINAYV